jgi:hypothetical protein
MFVLVLDLLKAAMVDYPANSGIRSRRRVLLRVYVFPKERRES